MGVGDGVGVGVGETVGVGEALGVAVGKLEVEGVAVDSAGPTIGRVDATQPPMTEATNTAVTRRAAGCRAISLILTAPSTNEEGETFQRTRRGTFAKGPRKVEPASPGLAAFQLCGARVIEVTTNDLRHVATASEFGGSSVLMTIGTKWQSCEATSLKWPVMITGVPSAGGVRCAEGSR